MNTISINGKTMTFPDGCSVNVSNGVVQVDGKVVEGDIHPKGDVIVTIVGMVRNLSTDCSVRVDGYVKGNVDAGGSVNCGDVGGNVDAGGSVSCGDVSGDLDAGGSVLCVSGKR